jgi:ATP-dependent protease HslVU (ClpYQ) peptidase subunit
MTIICWDGKTLAADKQSTFSGYGVTVTKIHRVPGGIVGFAGNAGHARALLEWFRQGMIPENWPTKGGEDSAYALFITNAGEVRGYSGDDGPHFELYEDKHIATGAGRDYALAAMYLGCDARKAVEVACALDNCCGKGIDTLELE